MRTGQILLLAVTLLLAACPAPQDPAGHKPEPSAEPSQGASAEPTAAPSSLELRGRLFDLATGKPLAGAAAILGDQEVVTEVDGGFAARFTAEAPSSVTFLAEGYVPLTIAGYAGGPLFMRPYAPVTLDIQSVVVDLHAPAGVSTASVLAIAVQPKGHAYASPAYLGKPEFSAAGTASVKVSLPKGDATLLAYGTKGTMVGALQAAVAPTLSLTLSKVDRYDGYQIAVPEIRQGGGTTRVASYNLTWPSDTPDMPNQLGIGVFTLESTVSVALPPAAAFGIAQAAYSLTGSALTNRTPLLLLSERTLRPVPKGASAVSLLHEPQSQALTGTFGIRPGESAGATAYYADVLDPEDGQPCWRLVSQGATPVDLTLPRLPAAHQHRNLTAGKTYTMRAGAAIGLLGFKSTEAYAHGQPIDVLQPSADQP